MAATGAGSSPSEVLFRLQTPPVPLSSRPDAETMIDVFVHYFNTNFIFSICEQSRNATHECGRMYGSYAINSGTKLECFQISLRPRYVLKHH